METTIGFEEQQVTCIIGDLPEERETEQTLLIDLLVEADISRCFHTDQTTDTVDYVRLADICSETAQQGKYRLLETLAHNILIRIVTTLPVKGATIKIRKPAAFLSAKCAKVEMRMRA